MEYTVALSSQRKVNAMGLHHEITYKARAPDPLKRKTFWRARLHTIVIPVDEHGLITRGVLLVYLEVKR